MTTLTYPTKKSILQEIVQWDAMATIFSLNEKKTMFPSIFVLKIVILKIKIILYEMGPHGKSDCLQLPTDWLKIAHLFKH